MAETATGQSETGAGAAEGVSPKASGASEPNVTGAVVSGVGIDLVEIGRLERALERRPGLAERLFSEAELGYARARRRPAMHLAARFAAKEAVIKALGLTGGVPSEIEVVAGAPPTVRLHGGTAKAAAGLRVHVSLTHAGDHASAVALAEAAP